jgi:opacity protein-like surface antigen
MYKFEALDFRCALWTLVVLMLSGPAVAADLDITGFGGVHQQGKLTLQSVPSTTVNLVRTINSTTFGVFGVRIGHGHIFGGEHTLAYSPHFIDSDTRAITYNSNVRLQAPLPVVRPYGTAGLGLIHSWGEGLGVFGTKFALNYGGGIKFMPAGPVGIQFDLRGYAVPSTEFRVFRTESQRLDFLEATVGIVYRFGR